MAEAWHEYFEYVRHPLRLPQLEAGRDPVRHAVAIVGAGPIGLTLALGLARHGVRPVLIEADDTVTYGSRAACISRRSLEIFATLGVDRAILSEALGWTAGTSFYRDVPVYRLQMPMDANQKYPPMVNLQQCMCEQALVERAEALGIDIRWQTKLAGLEEGALQLQTAAGAYRLDADWIVACDGARSLLRQQLGLKFSGTTYEGTYIIVDVHLKSDHPTERRAWFDPPSNPGSTILMHRQPRDIWRVDYQLRDDEDPAEAVKPGNVLPRVRQHLDWIGERADWVPVWISAYRANCLTLERYRHGRVLFAGDAAHLVPIFGVRGLNSGVEDAHNLAWKLARVVQGTSGEALLDTYSAERVHAARENIRSASKSTEFMAPPSNAFKLMREAVLGLSVRDPFFRTLVNPRQTSAIAYADSPLNAADSEAFDAGPVPGAVLAECALAMPGGRRHLTELVGEDYTLLAFGGAQGVAIAREGNEAAHALYGATPEAYYLVRPDGHVAGRWKTWRPDSVRAAIGRAQC